MLVVVQILDITPPLHPRVLPRTHALLDAALAPLRSKDRAPVQRTYPRLHALDRTQRIAHLLHDVLRELSVPQRRHPRGALGRAAHTERGTALWATLRRREHVFAPAPLHRRARTIELVEHALADGRAVAGAGEDVGPERGAGEELVRRAHDRAVQLQAQGEAQGEAQGVQRLGVGRRRVGGRGGQGRRPACDEARLGGLADDRARERSRGAEEREGDAVGRALNRRFPMTT